MSVVITVCDMNARNGRYVAFRNGQHRITVRRGLSPRQAARTVVHELAHGLQVERLGSYHAFDELWSREQRAAGITSEELRLGTYSQRAYDRMPLEAEAEAMIVHDRAHGLTRLCIGRT